MLNMPLELLRGDGNILQSLDTDISSAFPEERRVLLAERVGFEFFIDLSGRYFLDVLCGGIGLFNICIELNEDEINRYREWGDFFIQKLALDIQHSPGSFRSRAVSPRRLS